jgi:tight adherence protein B
MELVANEMDPPISDEFSKVIHESQVGIDLKTSFHRMLERVDSTELKLMTIAVLIQREVGGNLSEILDIILETIRERIQLKGEIKAITAQGRASAALIGALPPLLLVVMNFINPDYMSPLFTTFLGQGILAGCFMMECIGIYMIMQIIKVDF